jgi:hypothetical protein
MEERMLKDVFCESRISRLAPEIREQARRKNVVNLGECRVVSGRVSLHRCIC